MATFATAPARGTVIDAFAAPDRLDQLARELVEADGSFRTQMLVSRGLSASAGEATAPKAQRLRRVDSVSVVEARLGDDLRAAFRRSVVQVVPQAQRASIGAIAAYALDDGDTLRVDLASDPALPTDVTLTFVCAPGGGAEATLRVLSGPLSGWGEARAPAVVPLAEGQAALIPALWPAEIVAHGAPEPVLAVVVLARVETS